MKEFFEKSRLPLASVTKGSSWENDGHPAHFLSVKELLWCLDSHPAPHDDAYYRVVIMRIFLQSCRLFSHHSPKLKNSKTENRLHLGNWSKLQNWPATLNYLCFMHVQFQQISINFFKNHPVKIGLEEIEKL